ncbi:uncharacterized protein [Antedon mediterranea]|uniref:uncharacterized protein isoform X2 n=1 Tax=Antedon mediterranea TaxID=105859 RepID=UPI003AF8B3BE
MMTAVTKAPNVNSTIEHLQELGDRMRTSEYTFQDADVDLLNAISQSIKDLDIERVQVHNTLEIETIAASLLRNKLQFFPSSIKREIKDAVESARSSNAEELKNLQDELTALNDSLIYLEDKQKNLSKENAILHPERDMVRQQHEEVISQLNQRMADKASKQITLNETRDQLRDTNQKIVDLETGIIILKEDMIQERADARQEKKRLKQAVHDTTKRTKKQKEANIAKKKELDQLHDQVLISENQLSDIRRTVRRYETSRLRLEGQEEELTIQLNKELKENEDLVQKGEDLANMQLKLTNKYERNKLEHNENMKQLQSEIAQTKVGYDKLDEEWKDLRVDEATASDIQKREGVKVKELDDALQSKKSELMTKANETARMKQENDVMEMQMKQLDENHQITIQLLQKQIEDFRNQLAKERKERFDLQEKRDALSREVEDFRSGFNKFMHNINERMDKAKTDHRDLKNEAIQLKKNIGQDEIDMETLGSELHTSENAFGKMKSQLENVIGHLQGEIEELENQLAEKIHTIEERTPAYEKLENTYMEEVKEYEDKKKKIVKLKNKKQNLETTTSQTKHRIEKLAIPITQLRQKIKEQRSVALDTMKTQGKELKDIETKIYHAGRKLKAVFEENDKFKTFNTKMDVDTTELEELIKLNDVLEETLKTEVISQRGVLEKGWKENKKLEKQFAKRDQVFLDGITDLQHRTNEREQKVAGVTDQLCQELVLLSTFLENVSSRRPLDTRQGSKPDQPSIRPSTAFNNYLDSYTSLPPKSITKLRQQESMTGDGDVRWAEPLSEIVDVEQENVIDLK